MSKQKRAASRQSEPPAHISLNDLTSAERDRLEAGGKRWARKFKARKTAIRLSGRITRADLAVQINEKS